MRSQRMIWISLISFWILGETGEKGIRGLQGEHSSENCYELGSVCMALLIQTSCLSGEPGLPGPAGEKGSKGSMGESQDWLIESDISLLFQTINWILTGCSEAINTIIMRHLVLWVYFRNDELFAFCHQDFLDKTVKRDQEVRYHRSSTVPHWILSPKKVWSASTCGHHEFSCVFYGLQVTRDHMARLDSGVLLGLLEMLDFQVKSLLLKYSLFDHMHIFYCCNTRCLLPPVGTPGLQGPPGRRLFKEAAQKSRNLIQFFLFKHMVRDFWTEVLLKQHKHLKSPSFRLVAPGDYSWCLIQDQWKLLQHYPYSINL